MLNRSFTAWRYLDTGSLDPYTNMAVDEAILSACAEGIAPPTLRLYGWSPPAFSVGAFQRIEGDPFLEACIKHLPFVRRFTGGKAVWHDQEITYSFAAPLPCSEVPSELRGTYRLLGECFLEAFRLLGLEGRCESPRPSPRSSSPLCFAVRAPFEIVLDGRKVVGSAQRRLRHAFLQHGSILLNGDGAPPLPPTQSPPQADRRGASPPSPFNTLTLEQIKEAVRRGFETRLGRSLEPGTLSRVEQAITEDLLNRKYRSKQWNLEEGRLIDAVAARRGS